MKSPLCAVFFLLVFASLQFEVRATSSDLRNAYQRQRNLFEQMNNENNWRIPIEGEPEMKPEDEEAEKLPPGLKFLEEVYNYRQREFDEKNQAGQYDSTSELDSSQPYGIQNVADGVPGRITRSRNRISKSTFQSLCASVRVPVILKYDPDFEYRPDHYDEVLCAHHSTPNENRIQPQVCGEAGFHCIPLNRTLYLTRRARGSDGCWESESRVVAAGCECMWPKHNLGDIEAHH